MQAMSKRTYMFVGGHPDDADNKFGGTAILLKKLGCDIVFVAVTDGSAGHPTMDRQALAVRRRGEAELVAEYLGITYVVMDTPDGELVPDLPTRSKLIRLIREHKPDVLISHKPTDYHPDHRAAGQLVQDCSFLLTVPLVCPDVPAMSDAPYVFHIHGSRRNEFQPDVLVDIGSVVDQKMHSLALHESQIFEWLPFIGHFSDETPKPTDDYLDWMKRHWGDPGHVSRFAKLHRNPAAAHLEVLERCEYGSTVTPDIAQELFPFATVNFSETGRK